MRRFPFLALLLLPGVLLAQDDSPRRMTLGDGRVLTGSVVESTAEGMRLKVAQGTTLVRYDQLAGVEVVDAAALESVEPWVIAVAPVADPDIGTWLAAVAAQVPATRVMGPESFDGTSCAGDTDCLAKAAAGMNADYVLIGAVDDQRQMALEARTATSAVVGTSSVFVPSERPDAAPALLGAVFSSLSLRPTIDLMAAAEASLRPPEPEPVVAEPVAPEPEPEPTPEPEPAIVEVQPTPEPVVVKTPAKTSSTSYVLVPPKRPLVQSRSRGTAIALGFAPVPGLPSAYLGDGPGFVASLAGTFATSALTVYALGSEVQYKQPLVASSILLPYVINVAFNQVATLVGWRRLYGTASVARRPSATVAPVLSWDGQAPRATGAALTLGGRF